MYHVVSSLGASHSFNKYLARVHMKNWSADVRYPCKHRLIVRFQTNPKHVDRAVKHKAPLDVKNRLELQFPLKCSAVCWFVRCAANSTVSDWSPRRWPIWMQRDCTCTAITMTTLAIYFTIHTSFLTIYNDIPNKYVFIWLSPVVQ